MYPSPVSAGHCYHSREGSYSPEAISHSVVAILKRYVLNPDTCTVLRTIAIAAIHFALTSDDTNVGWLTNTLPCIAVFN